MPDTTSTTSTASTGTTNIVTLPASVPVPAPAGLLSYATFADFTQRFQEAEVLQISQAKISNPTTPDQPRVESALRDASDLVDTYLRARYASGLALLHDSPPPAIVRHVCNIARYYLAQNKATEQQRQMFDDAIAWCLLVIEDGQTLVTKDGTTITDGASSGDGGGTSVGGVVYTAAAYSHNSPDRTFTQRGFKQQSAATRYGRGRWF